MSQVARTVSGPAIGSRQPGTSDEGMSEEETIRYTTHVTRQRCVKVRNFYVRRCAKVRKVLKTEVALTRSHKTPARSPSYVPGAGHHHGECFRQRVVGCDGDHLALILMIRG
ncbi:hypothetical protein GQ600_18695 [Phytophthora cactorum]|nr:hypothetical protein GQ600_18695 [Phytophthora cactorum]